MKTREIKKLSNEELETTLNKLKKDLFNMRFKKINGQIQNLAEYSTIKKNIARLYNNIIGAKK